MSDRLSQDLASLRITEPGPEPPRPWGRLWLPGVSIALVMVAFVAGPRIGLDFAKADEEVAEAAPATVPVATSGIGEASIVASGYVVARVTSKVGAGIEGRIESVFVREGDVVKKGDPLFALDTTRHDAMLTAAKARVAASKARAARHKIDLAETTRKLQREERLLGAGAVSKAEVDELRAQAQALRQTLSAARAEVDEAEAKVAELAAESELRNIRAPIDGTVITDPADVGQVVAPLLPALLEIADPSSLVVEVDVPEGRLSNVEIGGPCIIVLDAYPARRYQGAVVEISPVVNRAKATVVARVRFVDAHDGVLQNMAARVSFLASEAHAAGA